MSPRTFDSFTVLRLPLADESPFVRHVVAKPHTRREGDPWPEGRTLFLTSLDDFVTEADLKKALAPFGKIEEVYLKRTQKADGTNVLAHVVFKNAGAVQNVVSQEAMEAQCVLPLPKGGRKRWAAEDAAKYRKPEQLQTEVDRWMENFEQKESEEARKAAEPEVDEDGFTKVKGSVTRGEGPGGGVWVKSFRAPKIATGSFEIGGGQEQVKQKKNKRGVEEDFYKFQHRMKRVKDLHDMRAETAKDHEEVLSMKKKRKFKD